MVDITLKKRDVSTITSINTSKSLVYQAIPVVIGDLILVILLTIDFIKDQVRATLNDYLNISFYYI